MYNMNVVTPTQLIVIKYTKTTQHLMEYFIFSPYIFLIPGKICNNYISYKREKAENKFTTKNGSQNFVNLF